MGIFEDVMSNAKSAAVNVGKKAGRLVDISKLRMSAAELNNEINKRYEALGRVVYNAAKEEQDVKGLIDECAISIDALYLRLDEVNEKINRLQNKTVCPVCSAQNPESSMYCSQCGNKLRDEVYSEEENEVVFESADSESAETQETKTDSSQVEQTIE
ncbi:MAG: zinc-ribbon domain-containing protein [Acutalibacteraceae bacterium]